MSITRADIVAAREAADSIPKEAAFGDFLKQPLTGNPESQIEADNVMKQIEAQKQSFQARMAEHLRGTPDDQLEARKKELFKKETASMTDLYKKYQDASGNAAQGGMIDRYTGSAGGIGAAIGAIFGALFGGKQGALLGGLLGGAGLYVAQKLGLGGDSFQEFFKGAVDTVMGAPGDAVSAAEQAKVTESLTQQADVAMAEAKNANMTNAATADAETEIQAGLDDDAAAQRHLAEGAARRRAENVAFVNEVDQADTGGDIVPETPITEIGTNITPPVDTPAAMQVNTDAPPAAAPLDPTAEQGVIADVQQRYDTKLRDALMRRRAGAKQQHKLNQSAIGSLNRPISDAMSYVKEGVKVPGTVAGQVKDTAVSGAKELAGLGGDVTNATASMVKAPVRQVTNAVKEGAGNIADATTNIGGLVKDVAGTAASQGKAGLSQLGKALQDKLKETKHAVQGFTGK